MRESKIESTLRRRIEDAGGMCMKFTSPQLNGVPDRLILIKGLTVFVETKSTGDQPRALQKVVIRRMRKQGAYVAVVNDMAKIPPFMDWVHEHIPDALPDQPDMPSAGFYKL